MVRNLTVRKEREKELYNAAKKLKPQGLSGVIETPQSVHIIKLKEYSPERQLTFDEAKPKIEEKLKGPYQDKKTKEWEEELKKDAKIELMPDAVGLGQQEQKAEAGQVAQ
jgi:parvulin-like peptidyl-prolyl isomerase